MDENKNDQPAAVETEGADEQETPEADLTETTDWEAEAKKARRIAARLRTKLTKASETKKETPPDPKPQEQAKPADNSLLQKAFLRSAGITAADEVELALSTAKKWGMEVDNIVDDEDFQVKLDKLRTQKANATATSNIKGGAGAQQAKLTAEYWIKKGTPPTPDDIPDRKTRQKIVMAVLSSKKNNGKTFYND